VTEPAVGDSGNLRVAPRPPIGPLDADELWRFYECGFLKVGRVIDLDTVERLRRSIDDARARRHGESDLLDPAEWPEGDGGVPQEPGRNVSFLFNMWRHDPEFARLTHSPHLAALATQLLGVTAVRILEDNALTKDPHTGGELKWHQDYSYWPLGQPSALTVWIALDKVTLANGAVQMALGSHLLGERLPAVFGTGAVYFRDRRPPVVEPVSDPHQLGLTVEALELEPGEASIHHALTWHASGPNTTDQPRRAAVVRYVADGTTWFGARRYEFNYSDEEVGLRVGDPIGGEYFPLVGSRGSGS
jgi:ectoine hydroxylase-related dioxygenase (phytanoyl-CoA dioxygenase family)